VRSHDGAGENRMARKILVFDFDGTIADSKKLYTDIIHDSLAKASFIYPRSHIVRAMGPKLEGTLLNLRKFDRKTLKKLSKEINDFVIAKAESLKVCANVKSELRKLHRSGKYRIVLLTNSVRAFSIAFLKKNKMLNDFDLILGSEDFMDKPKELRILAKKYKVNIKDLIYIGDRIMDYKIARQVGAGIVLPRVCSWDKSEIMDKKYSKVRIENLGKIEGLL